METSAVKAIRVVRVGGSLLTWDGLRGGLRRFLQDQTPATNILISGGGPWVELLRQRDHALGLDAVDCHWMSIRALGLTAQLLSVVTGFPLVSAKHGLIDREANASSVVFDVEPFMRQEEPALGGTPLPPSWDVTSDSIAARVAWAMSATELVLLKSAEPPPGEGLSELTARGFVDAFFCQAAQGIPRVRCVNLRAY